jgi:uncharacterized membrane protein
MLYQLAGPGERVILGILGGWTAMTAHSHRGRRGDDLPGLERLLGLSDNVVAFALTLLVLQVRVPPRTAVADPASAADLAAQLASQAGHLVSYVIAFYVIAQFWLTHRRVFRHVIGHRDSLAWWNFAFLATITVMPFTSSLLGEYPANPLAVDIFAVNLLLAVVATRTMSVLGQRWGLLADDADTRDLGALRVRSAAVLLVVALSIGLAWVNTTAAKYCWVLIPVVQWAIERRSRRAAPGGRSPAPGQ